MYRVVSRVALGIIACVRWVLQDLVRFLWGLL